MLKSARAVATRIARTTMPIALLLGCSLLAGLVGRASAAPDDDALKDPALTVAMERGEIALDGDLAEGTARRLRVLLRTNPGVRALSLESDGGLVDEAEQIGDIVAAHGLTTVVRKLCVSACTLAYVRGRERIAQSGAKLGFHAPWLHGEGIGDEPVSSEDERQAYIAAGIAPDFVAEALAIPAESVWFPDEARLLKAKVVTAVLPAKVLSLRLAAFMAPRRLAAAPE